MRRFLCQWLPEPGERAELDEAASHHLLRVTGIAPGERVELFDGAGRAVVAVFVEARSGRAVIEGAEWVEGPPARRQTWLLVAVLKGPAMQTAVRMATELGVTRIWPVLARRSVAQGKAERWRRIAEAAAAQCGRADVPEVEEAASLQACLGRLPPDVHRRAFAPGCPVVGAPEGDVALLVGPEGGLDEVELGLAVEQGFELCGLGSLTLRADTAVVAALAQLQS